MLIRGISLHQSVWKWVVLLITLHVGMLAYSSLSHSPVSVETSTMVAGIRYCQSGKYDLFVVNPPLVPVLAALPAVLSGVEADLCCHDSTRLRPEYVLGDKFVEDHGCWAFWMFTIGRWVCIPLSVVGALICYHWARELYGSLSGLLALVLWCFSPSILGHGALVTSDVAAASFGVSAGYFFWRYLKNPDWKKATLAGLAFGLAQLTKATWALLFGLWPFLWLLWIWADHRNLSLRGGFLRAMQFGFVLLVGIVTLNLGYAFEGSFQRLGKFEFVSKSMGAPGAIRNCRVDPGNRFRNTSLSALPVPLPRSYVSGIDIQKQDFEVGHFSYLKGIWESPGWWYYYLYAFSIKVPIGFLCLLLIAIVVTCAKRGYSARWRDEFSLLIPAVAILFLVSSQTGMNHHFRYVLPAFPFLFIWTSKVARALEGRPHLPPLFRRARVLGNWLKNRKQPEMAVMVVLALTWSIGSSLAIYPHSLSYFNELAAVLPTPADASYPKLPSETPKRGVWATLTSWLSAGPRSGPRHLLNSNIDWGQDLFFLKDWLDEHPEVKLDGLAYYGSYPATLAGIPETPYPMSGLCEHNGSDDQLGPKPGWYALSVNYIYGRNHQYRYFLNFEPVAMAGYSIYIYHVTFDEANRVRRELGLPELKAEGVRRRAEKTTLNRSHHEAQR